MGPGRSFAVIFYCMPTHRTAANPCSPRQPRPPKRRCVLISRRDRSNLPLLPVEGPKTQFITLRLENRDLLIPDAGMCLDGFEAPLPRHHQGPRRCRQGGRRQRETLRQIVGTERGAIVISGVHVRFRREFPCDFILVVWSNPIERKLNLAPVRVIENVAPNSQRLGNILRHPPSQTQPRPRLDLPRRIARRKVESHNEMLDRIWIVKPRELPVRPPGRRISISSRVRRKLSPDIRIAR
jgi:hypothetical protein